MKIFKRLLIVILIATALKVAIVNNIKVVDIQDNVVTLKIGYFNYIYEM